MTRILRCSFAEQEIFYFVTFNTSKHFFSRNFNTYLSINHYNNLIKHDRLIIKKKNVLKIKIFSRTRSLKILDKADELFDYKPTKKKKKINSKTIYIPIIYNRRKPNSFDKIGIRNRPSKLGP